MDERIDEGLLWWFSHVERMENYNVVNRVYIGECAEMSDWMSEKEGEWHSFVRENVWGVARRDEPLTSTRCHNCGLPRLYEALEGWKSVFGQAYSLGHKGEIFCFSSLS